MKQTPDYSKAEANMQSGVITADGFLGEDTRPLADIIEHDEELFAELNITFDSVAEKLEYLMKKGQTGLGEPITVDDTWLVRTDETRGYLPSPFGDGVFHKINVEVELKGSGKTLLFTEMNIHMLRKFHFLEGKGSTFRMEPALIKEVLIL
ncbi:hypothetical protein [Salinispira pacifica]|uniref:Uncharacterized protein n=1 Tax=Salinispira pacifica TaxID=1307761 RepID=V5WIB3_9SPIO|nr:hypothetical protein [Salinispira pacifica]AHC15552.1 hypothetical protein L21SP2_2189 [Salinispira pacifica]